MSSVCEVVVCETISPDGGVCHDCVDKTMNSGGCLECANEECDIRFMCDNCGSNPIEGYMGGDSSAFLCCAGCWAEVEALDPEERDYQAAQLHDLCLTCRKASRKKTLEEIERFSGMPTLEYDEILEALHDKLIIAEDQLMVTCEGCGGEIIPEELEHETLHFIPENGWCAGELPECGVSE